VRSGNDPRDLELPQDEPGEQEKIDHEQSDEAAASTGDMRRPAGILDSHALLFDA